MKDDNLAQKEKNDNSIQEYINKIISSPKQDQKDSYTNSLLSPEQNNSMNQKFFPSKENFFGIKTSPKNMVRPISPAHSPILNYYAGLSPKAEDFNNLSPKNDYYNNLNTNSFSGKLSPNFNYSPSTIFNVQNSNKDIKNSFNNNFSFPNNLNNIDDDSKTLQEKMAPFVQKTDANNFIRKSSFPSNNNLEEKNDLQSEEEDEDNEGAFTLTFDNFDDDYLKDQKSIQYNENIQLQKKPSTGISNSISGNNIYGNIPNNNEQFNQNTNEKKSSNVENPSNEKTDNNIQEKESSLVKNIINKKEFKPYIPNKYRNNPQNLNNIPNQIEGQIYQSYKDNIPMDNSQNYNMQNISPEDIEQYISYRNNNIGLDNNNKFSMDQKNEYNNIKNNDYEDENLYNNFYYNGDNYKISNFKEYKKKDYLKTGEIPSISAADIVTAITANNKKIKRIDPNTYLNESIEYLSYNIFPLAKDQAGCRFLQEKIEKDPIHTIEPFYKAILPYVLPLVKDPFGNYLIQKLFYYLSPEQIKKILEIITPTILDIGSNCHGTRVIQHLINFLSNRELVNYFLNSIKPYIIPLLKELNGTHIINKFINDHPECADEVNKIIVESCSLLATHRHGCCILQKMLEGPDKRLKNNLITNLIENCFVLIIDQFGNYVIQSILLLNEHKSSSAIAMKICDNVPYYSKHRYSSNVIEKCFDFCGKKEKRKLIERISTPETISDLILDEHGNYVVQKALYYADSKEKEIILNIIKPLIPKIKVVPFGEKLLLRLFSLYPQLNGDGYKIEDNTLSDYFVNNNYYNKSKGNKKKGKKKKKKNENNNEYNYNDNNINNKNDLSNNNNTEINNNISLNNFYNINNNTINININSNNNPNNNNSQIESNKTNSTVDNKEIKINTFENNNMVNNMTDNQTNINNPDDNNPNNSEPKKKKKKKKGKKKKKVNTEESNDNPDKKINTENNDKVAEDNLNTNINQNNEENKNKDNNS